MRRHTLIAACLVFYGLTCSLAGTWLGYWLNPGFPQVETRQPTYQWSMPITATDPELAEAYLQGRQDAWGTALEHLRLRILAAFE